MRPMFPDTLSVNGSPGITLRADGTWDGDVDAFVKAASEMQRPMMGGPITAIEAPLVWLIVRALQQDMRDAKEGTFA